MSQEIVAFIDVRKDFLQYYPGFCQNSNQLDNAKSTYSNEGGLQGSY